MSFTWTVELADAQSGATHTRTIRAAWSPEHELTEESVELAARVEAKRETGKEHLPLGAPVLVTA